jgi:acetylglutamate kinase
MGMEPQLSEPHSVRSDWVNTTVVKLGGALLDNPEALAEVWRSSRNRYGNRWVFVHGGGPQSTALARRLGHEPRLVAGRRITTDLDLDISLWALRGSLNARLVAGAQAAGLNAAGISAADGGTVGVNRRPPRQVDGEMVDFGHVGDVSSSDRTLLDALLNARFVPIVAPVCGDGKGNLYNVNADTVAVEVALALWANELLFVAEAGAVFRSFPDPESRLASISRPEFEEGVAEGWISEGMRPKLETAFDAHERGIAHVRICGPDGLAGPAAGTRITSA